ncbi:MAG: TIGR00341 family protein [Bacteroidales bacterium]|nr:TIGR00341 family protein [Bacteroidales bacterium]HNW72900.1 TIGR00341 family protein [Bacteroidales bacterium]HPS50571.1 TIGR00341 family protein [Bacteroidales bacterium]
MNIFNLFRKILSFFNLEAELEQTDSVYEEIKKGIVFKGTNLWILFFAIIVASVGLNMNSTAVIIGAMLISPLMGPINGMGYSIATYDFELFRKSLKNFSFAILTSLIASTTYFVLSPLSTASSELLARTSPTIYDVLIALFGGLAGIIAISSKQKGNVIPGVAIATALMPPLCTAGYGLATLQFHFFFGAFYLFTINTIFIAIASVWVSQLLKFPNRSIIDEGKKKKINRIISLIIAVVLLPSIFFGYKMVKQEEFLRKANQYVSDVSLFEGNYLLKHDIDVKSNKIILVYGGTELTKNQKQTIIKKSQNFNINNATILIEQGLNLSSLDDKNIELYQLKGEIINLNFSLNKKNFEIDSMINRQKFGETLLKEIITIFPQIEGCLFTESLFFYDNVKTPNRTPVVILSFRSNIRDADKRKINNWFRQRLKSENLKIYYEKSAVQKVRTH